MKQTCELCGKKKKQSKMVEYYLAKRSNHDKVMYKCEACSEAQEDEDGD